MPTTTTETGGPLTLVTDPTRVGLTVIPTSTPLTRLNYFDGKFLRAEDFRLEQAYERTLTAMSVRGGGSGVVHGFELAMDGDGGDAMTLRGGLAVAPSGRVIHLPSNASLSLARLLARSGDTSFDPTTGGPGASSSFGPCEVETSAPPDVTVAPQPAYVITIASDEALCGEEERFGALCADACVTDVDRSRRVEGVRVRARRLDLAGLPTSTAVVFGSEHHRSRLATAYFEAERVAVPSLISGAGLQSLQWCSGAAAAGGEEVPIALVAVTGTTFDYLDLWIARRELMVEPARRSWATRMAMRPWDVFLAQILQFQCQLRDPATGGGGGTVPSGCVDERAALQELYEAMAEIRERFEQAPDVLQQFDADGDLLARYRKLTAHASKVLIGATPAPVGGLLVARGFVSTPSAGYLPVDPTGDVPAQARALFGGGVDLRFCVARADVVPHLLETAQHMERISLTAGLDDPTDKPQVDVILPDGRLDAGPATGFPAYVGTWRLLPRLRPSPEKAALRAVALEQGSAISLRAAARDSSVDGWRWAVAGYGEAEHGLGVEQMLVGIMGALGVFRDPPAEAQPAPEVPIFVDRDEADPQVVLRANRERSMARARSMMIRAEQAGLAGEPGGDAVVVDRPIAATEKRPVAMWFDVDVATPLDALPVGARARATMRLTTYSRAATNPVVIDMRFAGTMTVKDIVADSAPDGTPETVVVTDFDGSFDPLVVFTSVADAPSRSLRTTLQWRFGTTPAGRLRLRAFGEHSATQRLLPAFEWEHLSDTARQGAVGLVANPLEGGGGVVKAPYGVTIGDEWSTGVGTSSAIPDHLTLARVSLRRDDGALAVGGVARDLAEAAIDSIAGELSPPGRDPDFASRARGLLFTDSVGGSARAVATRDWVMFHRRRTIDCGGEVTEVPKALRRYRAYHATVADLKELRRFTRLVELYARNASELIDTGGMRGQTITSINRRGAASFVRTRAAVDDLGFELVGVVEFVEGGDTLETPVEQIRDAWRVQDRGEALLWQAAGNVGFGDGDDVTLRRLGAFRGAIAPLIDTSSVRSPVLINDIPDEFVGVGTDGVLFTIGLQRAPEPEPIPVDLSCHFALRLTKDQHAVLRERLAGMDPAELAQVDDELILKMLSAVGADLDGFEIGYAAQDVENPDALLQWWFRDPAENPPVEVFALIDAGVASSTGVDGETRKGAAALRALRTDLVPEHLTIGKSSRCGALLLLVRG